MTRTVAAVLAALLTGIAPAAAQDFPSRPVTVVAPFAAGGGNDVLARLLAPALSEALKQTVLIENVAGAGGMTGSARVARATPDGYTVGLGSVGSHAFSQTLYKRPLYNAATDFSPVAMIADQPLLLVTRPDLPAKTLQEFIAYAKANQGKMQYGSPGVGSATHLGCVLFNAAIGVDITHVPYKGGGQVMTDLIAGRIDYWCPFSTTAMPLVHSGKIKALALLARERLDVLPDLPTAHEQGLANFEASTWNAMFAPKGTPAPVVNRLNEAVMKALGTDPVPARLRELGMSPAAPARRSPEWLGKFVQSEIEKWAGPIKASGLSID